MTVFNAFYIYPITNSQLLPGEYEIVPQKISDVTPYRPYYHSGPTYNGVYVDIFCKAYIGRVVHGRHMTNTVHHHPLFGMCVSDSVVTIDVHIYQDETGRPVRAPYGWEKWIINKLTMS